MSDRPQTVVNVNVSGAPTALVPADPKSLPAAVLLWLFLGGLGAHRFYLRRPHAITILLLSVSVVVLSVFGIGLLILLAVGVWLLIDVFFLAKWVAEYNAGGTWPLHPNHSRLQPPAAKPINKPPPLQTLLLREASKRGGKLTITQGVMATEKSFRQVEACLREMVVDGHADAENHPETGAVVYLFPELS